MIYLLRALLVMFIAYGLAARGDMDEERRLSMQGYVNDHATVSSVADQPEPQQ